MRSCKRNRRQKKRLRIEWDEGEAKVWSAGEMIMRIDYEGQEITDVRYGA